MVDWTTVGTSLLAAGGGGAGMAYAVFKGLGSKWIDSRFARQLEESRQAHATATEHLRFKIAEMLDRSTKLTQREFEILPDIWGKADAAYSATAYLLHPWRNAPDFDRMPEAQVDEVLGSLDIPQFQKTEMKEASARERNQLYGEAMRWRDLLKAQRAARAFSEALSQGSIYVHPSTHVRLKEFEKRLADAIFDRKFDMENPRQPGDPVREDDDAKAFQKHGQDWFAELGNFLRSRYWSEDTKPQ